MPKPSNVLPTVTIETESQYWRFGWIFVPTLTRGIGHFDDSKLTRCEALAAVNRWNSQQPGRWVYWLICQDTDVTSGIR